MRSSRHAHLRHVELRSLMIKNKEIWIAELFLLTSISQLICVSRQRLAAAMKTCQYFIDEQSIKWKPVSFIAEPVILFLHRSWNVENRKRGLIIGMTMDAAS